MAHVETGANVVHAEATWMLGQRSWEASFAAETLGRLVNGGLWRRCYDVQRGRLAVVRSFAIQR